MEKAHFLGSAQFCGFNESFIQSQLHLWSLSLAALPDHNIQAVEQEMWRCWEAIMAAEGNLEVVNLSF